MSSMLSPSYALDKVFFIRSGVLVDKQCCDPEADGNRFPQEQGSGCTNSLTKATKPNMKTTKRINYI